MSKNIPYWGIDGCPVGWFGIGLTARGRMDCFIAADIKEAYSLLRKNGARLALIDIPIGLPSDDRGRQCDKDARELIKPRGGAVFPVPCRPAIEAYRKAPGDEASKKKAGKLASVKVTGGCLSEQTWAIVPKIDEVDLFLCGNRAARKLLREVHPEVCFRTLAGVPLAYSKKKPEGREERIRILRKWLPREPASSCNPFVDELLGFNRKDVGKDDILDALVAAITAREFCPEYYRTLPHPPRDDVGLPMEMLYVHPRK